MLVVLLIFNILTVVLLLMWVCAMIQQVAVLRADIEFVALINRHKLAKDLVDRGIKAKDVPKTYEELEKLLQECS